MSHETGTVQIVAGGSEGSEHKLWNYKGAGGIEGTMISQNSGKAQSQGSMRLVGSHKPISKPHVD